jgi:hypothetical protein
VLHALTLAGLALVAGAASAAAVGLTISEVDWANDISGTPVAGHTSAALTEQLLLSLRNATLAQVLADMGVKEGPFAFTVMATLWASPNCRKSLIR